MTIGWRLDFISGSSVIGSLPGAGAGAGRCGRMLIGVSFQDDIVDEAGRADRDGRRRSLRPSASMISRYSGSRPASASSERARRGSRVCSARKIEAACVRSSGLSRAFRDETARPSASRTVGTTRISTSSGEIANQLPDHLGLLRVLAAEERLVGPDDLEQLEDDGRDAPEVAGSELALESRAELGDVHPGLEARRVHLLGPRDEHDVDVFDALILLGVSPQELEVALLVARIRGEVLAVAELRGVHEEAQHDGVALDAGGVAEAQMALVERAHRRHEPDRSRAQRPERLPYLGDRPDELHAGTSAGSRSAMRAVAAARTR